MRGERSEGCVEENKDGPVDSSRNCQALPERSLSGHRRAASPDGRTVCNILWSGLLRTTDNRCCCIRIWMPVLGREAVSPLSRLNVSRMPHVSHGHDVSASWY